MYVSLIQRSIQAIQVRAWPKLALLSKVVHFDLPCFVITKYLPSCLVDSLHKSLHISDTTYFAPTCRITERTKAHFQ